MLYFILFYFRMNQDLLRSLRIRTFSVCTSLLIFIYQGCPTMQRLAALNGVIALVGSETAFLQVCLLRTTLSVETHHIILTEAENDRRCC